eukprot:scaffold8356_cov106-Skeletonema_dohrnii-CCMP3373.AAC.2
MRHKRAEAASCINCNPCTLACVVFTRRCQAALCREPESILETRDSRIYILDLAPLHTAMTPLLHCSCSLALLQLVAACCLPFKLKLGKMQERSALLYETFRVE